MQLSCHTMLFVFPIKILVPDQSVLRFTLHADFYEQEEEKSTEAACFNFALCNDSLVYRQAILIVC